MTGAVAFAPGVAATLRALAPFVAVVIAVLTSRTRCASRRGGWDGVRVA